MIEELDALLKPSKRDLPGPEDRVRIRKAGGIRQEDLAEVLKVSRLSVSMWEQGKTEPSGANRQKYVRALRHIAESVGVPWESDETDDGPTGE
ncbi:helix-turn-helix transcriptional regulator [Kitasatospora sp. NPDC004272]